MTRVKTSSTAGEIALSCEALKNNAKANGMKFLAHLLELAEMQARKEHANPGIRHKAIGRTHTHNLLRPN